MRMRIQLTLGLVAILFLSGCAGRLTVKDGVILASGLVQGGAAVAGSASNPSTGQPYLTAQQVADIVAFAAAARDAAVASASGWQNAVGAAWADLKGKIPASVLANVYLDAAVTALNQLLAPYGGNNPPNPTGRRHASIDLHGNQNAAEALRDAARAIEAASK